MQSLISAIMSALIWWAVIGAVKGCTIDMKNMAIKANTKGITSYYDYSKKLTNEKYKKKTKP